MKADEFELFCALRKELVSELIRKDNWEFADQAEEATTWEELQRHARGSRVEGLIINKCWEL